MILWQKDPECLILPKHFDVQFAEHMLNVLKAALNNLEGDHKSMGLLKQIEQKKQWHKDF